MKNPVGVQKIKNIFCGSVVRNIMVLTVIAGIIDLIIALSGGVSAGTANIANEQAEVLSKDIIEMTYYVSLAFTIWSIELIVSSIPDIVGWCLIYFFSKSANSLRTPSAGFTIFKVIAVLQIIYFSMGVLLGILMFDIKNFIQSILGLILFVIMLMWPVHRFKFFNSCSKSMKSTDLIDSGKVWGKMCIISAVFYFIVGIVLLAGSMSISAYLESLGIKGTNVFTTYLILTGISIIITGASYCFQTKLVYLYSNTAQNSTVAHINKQYNVQNTVPQNNTSASQSEYGNTSGSQFATYKNSQTNSHKYSQNTAISSDPFTSATKYFMSEPKRILFAYGCLWLVLIVIGLASNLGDLYWKLMFCLFI